MNRLKTLSPDNQFRFTCPVFGAEVRLSECVSLRDTYAIGKRPEQRRGCQACLASSKCPMVRMLQVIHRTGEDPGLYAAEPKTGSLPGDYLDHIAPIVVSEHLVDHYGVPPTEREMILAGNERTGSSKGRSKAKPEPISLESLPQEERAVRPRAKVEKPETSAATTGDMGAAITKAMKRAAQVPESPVQADPAPEPAVVASNAPTPPVAAPAAPKPKSTAPIHSSDLAKSSAKPLSLLEIARQRRAAQAA